MRGGDRDVLKSGAGVLRVSNRAGCARFFHRSSRDGQTIGKHLPHWAQKAQDALNDSGKPVKGSTILVLGVAYKKDVSDIRESPALDVIHLLEEKGAIVRFHDPHVLAFRHDGMAMEAVVDLDAALGEADCVIIATDHSAYDWRHIQQRARLLVDTRGVLRQLRDVRA